MRLIFLSLVLSTTLISFNATAADEIGRFKIVTNVVNQSPYNSSNDRVISTMIDTVTGDTWRLYGGKWEPIPILR